MKDYLNLSEDGYLLSKFRVHSSKIKEVVDLKQIDFSVPGPTLEDVKKDFDEKIIKEYSIRQLFEYVKVKEGDIVLHYYDIQPLSGSEGYLLIRDGYVYNSRITRRS